ncbi:class A sortase [Lacticaseibacillus mingshuiensis]|uniref:Class A sortase n=1 Tax=Lacticaseibacillus mingshuiensis TaxID=2799574 RepID=A0ABW4CFQ4_9LACO|nr:class A sortase [Lacticaseibacillus mingshuiensis]
MAKNERAFSSNQRAKSVASWLGRLMVTLGLIISILFCLGYLAHDQLAKWLVTRQDVAVTATTIKKTQRVKTKPTFDLAKVAPLTLRTLSQANLAQGRLPVVGEVAIPALKWVLPISEGVANRNLAFSAGTLKPGQVMGQRNYALAGHHMLDQESILFGPLVKSTVGMQIVLTDMTHAYVYEIWSREQIPATRVSVIEDNTDYPTLTLITCDDYGEGRLAVQARLTNAVDFGALPAAWQKLLTGK